MKPIVTIGVCVRDSEATLRDCIESIMQQNFPHNSMEVIFVDDGSKDKTLSIIQEYTSKIGTTVKTFHTPWKGLGCARNLVVSNAVGEYILWIDGDMVLSKGYVSSLVGFMEQNPDVGIAKGKMELISGANILGIIEMYSRAAGKMVDYRSEKARLKAVGTGGAIYRSEIFGKTGYFDENLRGYGEDWDMEIRAKKAGYAFSSVDATFLDYERFGLTWKALWKRYWLRGYYTHYFLHKNRGMIKHYRMFPPAAFISGLFHAFAIYKRKPVKVVFLLPLQYMLKMTAWYIGFVASHLISYEPE